MIFWLYIVACADGTLYTGIATDVERRIREHNGDIKTKGARYTRSRRPVRLMHAASFASRSLAAKEEARIKRLSRAQKCELIASAQAETA